MSVDVSPPNSSRSSTSTVRGVDQSTTSRSPDSSSAAHRERSPWLRRAILGVAVVAAIAAIAFLMSGGSSREDNSATLTHTIGLDDLVVTVTEQGTLESSNNTEIKCKVRGTATVLWVVEPGTMVEPGDELVRLDTSTIEDNINAQKIVYERALATHIQAETDVAVAKIAVTEYLEGTFRSQMKALEKDLAISEANLRAAQNMLGHSKRMFKRGFASELEVEGNEFAVEQAELEIELKRTEIDVLERFTKAKELETLRSTLKSSEAKLASDKAALDLEKARLDREQEQLENCVITAETAGMVIHPSAAQWKETPDIEEGATVRQDQVLLMIPDLEQMQVKVGIHESKVDRLSLGMGARITLQDETIDGEVSEIATVTRPAGWWTGNVVKYDTIIKLDKQEGLKPGMSAEVEVLLARHSDVLTIPVAAVVETETNHWCWVKADGDIKRRSIQLGDTNDQFIVVTAGLKAGDEVVLNPIAFVEEAQDDALRPLEDSEAKPDESTKPVRETADITS